MPLLQSILEELDRELKHLHEIRKIVAGLSRTPTLVSRYTEAAFQPAAPATTEVSNRSRKLRSDAGQRRGPRARSSPLGTRALTATVPSDPVVFKPSQLTEERARRQENREAEPALPVDRPGEDLDALSRSLAARWTTGAVE